MPELPEVETVRRGLEPVMDGARILSAEIRRPDLRFPFPDNFAGRLAGRRIEGLGRRAKYLTIHLSGGETVIAHLGMSGSFRILTEVDTTPGAFHHERSKDAAHDHVVLRLERDGAEARVIYNDPRRFGFMLLWPTGTLDEYPAFAELGPEPTGNHLSAELLAARLAGKSAPIKAALLDQSVVAGLGNIYVCEALHRAGISPRRKAQTLVTATEKPTPRLIALTGHIRDVISEAIAAGGSSLRDHVQTDGSLGYFQHVFRVYDREGEPCPRPGCGGTVSRIVQSGRSSFYCPSCQR